MNSPNVNSYHPDLVVEEAKNGWRIVRLNRPKSLHALDESIVTALLRVFEDFRDDEQVKAICWTRLHQKHFVRVEMYANYVSW